jgi:hypothetical protein
LDVAGLKRLLLLQSADVAVQRDVRLRDDQGIVD